MAEHVCPVWIGYLLSSPLRKLVHNPKKILGNYIEKEMVILDIGCGSGFFSKAMAEMISKRGKVIAADRQEGMLNLVEMKIQDNGLKNKIILHKCEEDKIGISEPVDFVLAFYMVHEVPDQINFLKEIRSILKENSILFIVEPKGHVSKKDFKKTVENAIELGFKPIKKPRILLSRAMVLKKVS